MRIGASTGRAAKRAAGHAAPVRTAFRRWLGDDRGHDLVEYMLLATFLGLAGWLGMQAIQASMHDTYEGWKLSTDCISQPNPPQDHTPPPCPQ